MHILNVRKNVHRFFKMSSIIKFIKRSENLFLSNRIEYIKWNFANKTIIVLRILYFSILKVKSKWRIYINLSFSPHDNVPLG